MGFLLFSFLLFSPTLVLASANDSYRFLDALRPKADPAVQKIAVEELISRLLPNKHHLFSVQVDPGSFIGGKDGFKLFKSNKDERLEIVGSSGVSVAWGLHYYLKEYCNAHVSWDGDQLSLPPILPEVNLTVQANDRFRYYQNVCTASYSFVWWDWPRWERELDWMALNGINLALAFGGQEEIWRQVYLDIGMTQPEIDAHFSGPAFLTWQRMGNLRGWGGPLNPQWHQKSVDLQKKVLLRMRKLGIIPVLPAFSGLVPRAFRRIYPNASMSLLPSWNSFKDNYTSPYILSPTDPLFLHVGRKFLNKYISFFGTDHVYNVDTFNENTPLSGDPDLLKHFGSSIFQSLISEDKDAIWMLQGWLFYHDFLFWTKERAKAFLTSAPLGRMIVLDLQSEFNPQYSRLDSYFGQPYIWCMLHNFGGTLGLHGSAPNINKGVIEARKLPGSSMVGVGLTPEGINTNYPIYDLMLEMAWRRAPVDLDDWFKRYSDRRYGESNEHANKAWVLLKDSVYNYRGRLGNHGNYVFVRLPKLDLVPLVWYAQNTVWEAWGEMIKASKEMKNLTDTFKYDLVDITRQSVQLILDKYYLMAQKAYKKKTLDNFVILSGTFLEALAEMDILLKSHKAFLLGNWIESAKKMGTNGYEIKLYETNARNQITLWGPNGEIRDYASKQWSGLVEDYYLPRWRIFFKALITSLDMKKKYNPSFVQRKIYQQVEKPFTNARKVYPTEASGDPVEISSKLFAKYIEPTFFELKHPFGKP